MLVWDVTLVSGIPPLLLKLLPSDSADPVPLPDPVVRPPRRQGLRGARKSSCSVSFGTPSSVVVRIGYLMSLSPSMGAASVISVVIVMVS